MSISLDDLVSISPSSSTTSPTADHVSFGIPIPKARRVQLFSSCLVPKCDGDIKCTIQIIKETLWDKFYTVAPQRQRHFAEQYKIVKKA